VLPGAELDVIILIRQFDPPLSRHAMELDHIGGLFGGNSQPCPFMCLLLKLLQVLLDILQIDSFTSD
jgi:hypothetical protein